MLNIEFFKRDACQVAQQLLGKVLRHKIADIWLSAMIIETEAYYLSDKGSHASLGFTEKRKALFMPAGTIYMYYARGGDSLNISCQGDGNAVLIKSAIPYIDAQTSPKMLTLMQANNPLNGKPRSINKLCAGQTLLCKSLGLQVPIWNQQQFDATCLRIDDVGFKPLQIIQTTRLGIPTGRDEHLLYRFISWEHAAFCSSNPLTKRKWLQDKDYYLHATCVGNLKI